MIGSIESLEMSSIRLVDAHTRASSSAAIAWVTRSAPAPPYSTGMPERRQLHRDQRVERVPVVSGEVIGLGRPRGDLVLAELAQHLAELTLLVGQRDRLHGPSLAPREPIAGLERT